MLPKFELTTFENTSIVRKFTIFYFLASIVPLAVLDFLYIQLQTNGRIEINEESFKYTLIFVVLGVVIGYATMRSILLRIVAVAQKNASTIAGIIGPEKLQFLGANTSNEIAILTNSFNEITSRLEENVRNLEMAKKTLHSVLAKVGEGMSSMQSMDSFLSLILETVTEALQSKLGVLVLRDVKDGNFYLSAVYGRKFDSRKRIRFDPPAGAFSEILQFKQTTVVNDAPPDNSYGVYFHPPVLCAPLLLHDKVLGFIAVSGRGNGHGFDEEERNILMNIALQTAVAVENSRLNDDAEKTYFETISALAMAVEAKDTYSRGHSDRVAMYAVQIAQQLNLSQEDITTLRDAAKLHDLGKIGIMDRILKKEAALDPDEMEMMKKHSEIGEGIIKPIRSLRHLCDIIRHHHERMDGSGYPDGFTASQITPLVRILMVADIYDALTTNRPYRGAFSPEKAMAELHNMKTLIDQNIVDALDKSLRLTR